MTTALHSALKVADGYLANATPEQAVIVAKVKGLLVGYDARWSGADWRLVGEAERTVRLPILNPESGRTSRTFTQAGKFDGIAAGYGKTVLLEHKSTSEDISDPDAPYWRRLTIDSQVSKYMLQAWQDGQKLDGCLYDVIRKPSIRPKKLTKEGIAEITTRGQYCGSDLLDCEIDAVLHGQLEESPELYARRLAAETTAEPQKYFARRSVPRLDSEVLDYASELWQIADEIRLARVNDRHFRNSSACMEFGRPCEYLGICSGHDSPDSDRWRRAESVHDELEGVGDGRDVLTNSRIKCFQTCRRKHFYRYELGLRRVQDDEPESLWLGTVLHAALAAWWTNLEGEQHGDSSDGSAVNAVAEPAAAG